MTVSFSSAARAEICKYMPNRHCCALAECFGILLFCNSFQNDGIKIITESREFAYILPKLFKKAFDCSFDSYPSLASPGKLVFQIWEEEKISRIMESFGFSPEDTLSLHVNYPLVEDECCKASFLRGAFLAGGSVTDPGKGYHMEFSTTHQSVARETNLLLREAMHFIPKMSGRGGGQVTVGALMHVRIQQPVQREEAVKITGTNKDDTSLAKQPKRRKDAKVYPNSPCPCGSGKKYKQCCGRK